MSRLINMINTTRIRPVLDTVLESEEMFDLILSKHLFSKAFFTNVNSLSNLVIFFC
jgi:hypothetical protein